MSLGPVRYFSSPAKYSADHSKSGPVGGPPQCLSRGWTRSLVALLGRKLQGDRMRAETGLTSEIAKGGISP